MTDSTLQQELDNMLYLFEQNSMRIREAPLPSDIFLKSMLHQKETAKQQIIALVQEAYQKGLLEGIELGANQVGELIKDVVKDYDKMGTSVAERTLAALQKTKDNK